AEAGERPVMVYDIPGRTGTALATDTIRRLDEVPHVRAVKDAKGDLFESSRLMAETDLLWFSGDDVANFAHLAMGRAALVAVPGLLWFSADDVAHFAHLATGAPGIVSVVGHVAGDDYRPMLDAIDAGDLPRAREIHARLIPAVHAIMHTSQGAIQVKAALKMQ